MDGKPAYQSEARCFVTADIAVSGDDQLQVKEKT